MSLGDVTWLMRNTVPLRGERRAAGESWLNVLADLGLGREDAQLELERARRQWDLEDKRRRRR